MPEKYRKDPIISFTRDLFYYICAFYTYPPTISFSSCPLRSLNVHVYAEICFYHPIFLRTRDDSTVTLAHVRNSRLVITKENSLRYHGFIWISKFPRPWIIMFRFQCLVDTRENNLATFIASIGVFLYLRYRRLNSSRLFYAAFTSV